MSEFSEYRFFGTESVIRGSVQLQGGKSVDIEVALSQYGQVVSMEPEVADALIERSPSALIIPDELWTKIGITPEELAEFPSALIHGSAPEDFRKKAEAVRLAHYDYRSELLAAAEKRATETSAEKMATAEPPTSVESEPAAKVEEATAPAAAPPVAADTPAAPSTHPIS